VNGDRRRLLALIAVVGVLCFAVTDAAADETGDAVEPKEIATDAVTGSLQGKDGLRIQTLCTHCNSANIQVGGLSRDLVPMSRDGFPIVGGLHTSYVLGVLPADSIAEAQVVKGPGGAALSNAAAGGEIRLTGSTATEVPWFDFLAQTGSYSLQRASARLAGSLAPWASGFVAIGTTEADPVDDDGDGWTDVPAVDRRFAEADLRLSPGSQHEILFGTSYIDEDNPLGRGAFDPFLYILEGEDGWTREDMRFERQEIRAGWIWRLPSRGALEVRALTAERAQTVRSQVTAVPDALGPEANQLIDRFDIDESNLWAAVSYEQPLGLSWRIVGGLETSRQNVEAINREPLTGIGGQPLVESAASESVDLFSAHVDVGWTPSPAWDLQFGLRRDVADLLTDLETEPAPTVRADSETSSRLTVRYFPARAWMLRLVAGETFRPPRPILAQVCCGQRYQTTENAHAERGRTVGLEVSYEPTPRLRAAAYLARTDFDDHLLRVVGWSQVFIQTYALANIPESTARRAELSLDWTPWSPLTLDASVGWLSFKNTAEDHQVDVYVTPPSRAAPVVVPITIDRVPYQAGRWASLSASLSLRKVLLALRADYTGTMPIQQFERLPQNSRLDTEKMRETSGFWLINLSTELPLNRHVGLLLAVNNVTDRIQDDLGDPTADYNWGPLAGRSWQAAVKVRLGG
jgi:outer membrane receptor protein involved in Fe transport